MTHAFFRMFCVVLFVTFSLSATAAEDPRVHGLWVWKNPPVVDAPQGAEKLRDFCQSQGINEVYVSVSANGDAAQKGRVAHLIALLHRSHIRVEALLSSENANEPGKHREKLLEHARVIVQFNRSHSADRFDGIHLDIEPQQRPENKARGTLDSCPVSWMRTAPCALWPNRPISPSTRIFRTNFLRAALPSEDCSYHRCPGSL